MAITGSASSLRDAVRDYEASMYAKTSLPALQSRARVWKTIHESLFPGMLLCRWLLIELGWCLLCSSPQTIAVPVREENRALGHVEAVGVASEAQAQRNP
eukprot:3017613-Amphidinium_carterae.1